MHAVLQNFKAVLQNFKQEIKKGGAVEIVRLTEPKVNLINFPEYNHPHTFPYPITILGKSAEIVKSPHETRSACAACLTTYLNKYSITCVECGNPIVPLMHIAEVIIKKIDVVIHAYCAPVGSLSWVWGEGVPVRLVEVRD